MSGLTQRNQAGQSGLVAAKVDFQRFATAGSPTWTKPGGVSIVWIECIGAGGSGGAQDTASGGGGGGGAFAWACFSADALPATLDVIVGAADNGSSGSQGVAGGHSQVDIPSGETEAGKVILIAYGGGGGARDTSSASGGGGGG